MTNVHGTTKRWPCGSTELVIRSRRGTRLRAAINDSELSTISNYAGKWNMFLRFCEADQCIALPATPETVTTYVGYLAKRGTIHADSMGQYVAAISKAHAHCGFRPPITRDPDELISSTLKGLSKLQKQIYSEDQVLYLPAPYVDRILDSASASVPSVQAILDSLVIVGSSRRWQQLSKTQRTLCENFRSDVMVCFNFCDFGRADTQARMSAKDVGIDNERQVIFRLRFVKGRGGKKTNLIFQWPAASVPALIDVLLVFKSLRDSVDAAAAGLMWRLPWERSTKWSTDHYDAVLRQCLLRHGFAAPDGFTYSSRSLRAGPVSAAKAIGVGIEDIRYLGG